MVHLSTTVQLRQTILDLAVAQVTVMLLPALALDRDEQEALDIIANSSRPVLDVFQSAIIARLAGAGYITRTVSPWGEYLTATPAGQQAARKYPSRATRNLGARHVHQSPWIVYQRAQFEHFTG